MAIIVAVMASSMLAAGPYPAMRSSLKLNSKQDVQIPPEACAQIELQLTKENSVKWDETISGFTPQILVSNNRRKDGACWVDVNAKDSTGAQASCRTCKVLWSGLPLAEVCYKATEVFYIEVFNPGPGMGTFTYENARLEAASVPCDDSVNPAPICTAADVPSCTINGDGTGGQVVGDPAKMTCQCQCISGWKPPNCDVKDFPPTPAPSTPIPPTPIPAKTPVPGTISPSTKVPDTLAPVATTNAPASIPSTSVPGGTVSPPVASTSAPVVTQLPAGMTYSPTSVPSPVTTIPAVTGSPSIPSAADSSDGSDSFDMWWIGIIMGGAALLLALIVTIYVLCCRNSSSKDRNNSANNISNQELMYRPPQPEPCVEAKQPINVVTENSADNISDSTFSCGRRSVGSENELFASDDYLPY